LFQLTEFTPSQVLKHKFKVDHNAKSTILWHHPWMGCNERTPIWSSPQWKQT
jgi:hypothetical protein